MKARVRRTDCRSLLHCPAVRPAPTVDCPTCRHSADPWRMMSHRSRSPSPYYASHNVDRSTVGRLILFAKQSTDNKKNYVCSLDKKTIQVCQTYRKLAE